MWCSAATTWTYLRQRFHTGFKTPCIRFHQEEKTNTFDGFKNGKVGLLCLL